jgi:soluble lytic murein transglycosylase-like protein
VRYLSRLHRAFGNLGLALVAYNAGPHRVSEYLRLGKPLPDRLQSYPRKVNLAYTRLLRQSGSDGGALSGSDAFRVKVARR